MSQYRFIEAEKGRYPVTRLCRMAQVSRAAYYQWQDGRESARAAADAALTAAIRAIHTASRGQYGVPRVLAELRAQGYDVGRKRVARLMAAAGLRGRRPPRWVRTTTPEPTPPAIPDRVHGAFTAAAPDVLWVGDITYVLHVGRLAVLGHGARRVLAPRDRLGHRRASPSVAGLRRTADGGGHARRDGRGRDFPLGPRLPVYGGRVPGPVRRARGAAIDGQDGRVLGQ